MKFRLETEYRNNHRMVDSVIRNIARMEDQLNLMKIEYDEAPCEADDLDIDIRELSNDIDNKIKELKELIE